MNSFVILFRQGPHPLTDAVKAVRQSAVAASHPAKDYNVAMEVRPWSAPTTQPILNR